MEHFVILILVKFKYILSVISNEVIQGTLIAFVSDNLLFVEILVKWLKC